MPASLVTGFKGQCGGFLSATLYLWKLHLEAYQKLWISGADLPFLVSHSLMSKWRHRIFWVIVPDHLLSLEPVAKLHS